MTWFALEFEPLLAVVAVGLDEDGVVLETNAGFRRLFGVDGVLPNGTPAARFFIQPDFASIVGAPASADGELYRGLLTVGEFLGQTQSLRGRIWRTDGGLRVLAEYDVKDLELLCATVLELNRDYANTQLAVAQSNLKLRHLNTALAQREAELEQHSDHLEELVHRRTLDLEQANHSAEVAHRDSEERLLTEAAARMQSRKLEAIGTLAAGIAHDFNNILGSIVGFAEMTGDTLPDGSTAKHNITQILVASFRARDLISRMLAFARQSPIERVAVDVVAEVREALALLRALMKPSVHLSLRSAMDDALAPSVILADPTQIQQIVMNLVINAAHAIAEQGTIRIDIDPLSKILGKLPHPVDGLCLAVTDNGCGMTPEVLERMFDPFFTTKAPNEGSGLGLSVVYGIVTDLGGVIEVCSCIDGSTRGTEFRVFLPLVSDTLQTGEAHGTHIVD